MNSGGYLPGRREESVHLALLQRSPISSRCVNAELVGEWKRLIGVRDLVLAHIEPLRKEKHIGSSLQAKVVLSGGGPDMTVLQPPCQ